MHFGTNHLGHFLLTELLLPLLLKSAKDGFNARIVTVSSLVHAQGEIHWDDLNWEKTKYNMFKAYNQSKLANVMHSMALSRRLEGTGVTTYSLNPGVVATEITRYVHSFFGFRLANALYGYVAKTPFYGTQTTLYCALSEDLSDASGRYYSDCKEKSAKLSALNVEDQERLWALSKEMVGL